MKACDTVTGRQKRQNFDVHQVGHLEHPSPVVNFFFFWGGGGKLVQFCIVIISRIMDLDLIHY